MSPATTVTKATIGNQQITVKTPTACIAPPGKLAVTAESTKRATGTKLKFSSVAFVIGRGLKHTRHRKRGNKQVTVVIYSPNAIVHHIPATVGLSVTRLAAGTHTLRVTFSYTKSLNEHHHETATVIKTLRVPFKVC